VIRLSLIHGSVNRNPGYLVAPVTPFRCSAPTSAVGGRAERIPRMALPNEAPKIGTDKLRVKG
jgi:hypothetical protein